MQETKVDPHIIDHLKVQHEEKSNKKHVNHTTKCEICEVDFESRRMLKLHNFEEHKNR